jgi:hypothetical protein
MNGQDPKRIPTGMTRRAREFLAGVGEHDAIGTMLEVELVKLLEDIENNNEASWQDIFEGADRLVKLLSRPDVDGDNGRELAKLTRELELAVDAKCEWRRTAQALPQEKK